MPVFRQNISANIVGGFAQNNYWSSIENNSSNAYNVNFNNGNVNNNRVRPVRGVLNQPGAALSCQSNAFFIDMKQLELFDYNAEILLEEVFEAYFACRKNKRKTLNAQSFETDYEKNIFQLWKRINRRAYKLGRSVIFILEKPVIREIFAADFRDRVVRTAKPGSPEKERFRSSVNSYLGILKHYNTFKLRTRFMEKHISCWWKKHFKTNTNIIN